MADLPVTPAARGANPVYEGLRREYIVWLLDRDPEYALKLLNRQPSADMGAA